MVSPEPNTGCWLWVGAIDKKGYGRVALGRRLGAVVASRVAWEMAHGSIPDGFFVCHRCDQPSCVNPGHLFLGTAQDNADDMVRKGRATTGELTPRGTAHYRAKFTDEDIRAMRAMRRAGERFTDIAAQYGISPSHARGIATGALWSHVPEKEGA
jgi:hypothetical protein